jgi:hypothetical protein
MGVNNYRKSLISTKVRPCAKNVSDSETDATHATVPNGFAFAKKRQLQLIPNENQKL